MPDRRSGGRRSWAKAATFLFLRPLLVIPIEKLAQGDDVVSINGESSPGSGHLSRQWTAETTWNELFSVLGPDLYQYQTEYFCQRIIAEYLGNQVKVGDYQANLTDHSKKIIKIQLTALGLVKIDELPLKGGGFRQFWKITDAGKIALTQVMSIKRDN